LIFLVDGDIIDFVIDMITAEILMCPVALIYCCAGISDGSEV